MKPILKYLFIALVALTLVPLSSCKKGPNDPFLSIHSRKARLSGIWKLSKSDYTVIEVKSNTTTSTVYTFDGVKYNTTETKKVGTTAATTSTNFYTYAETWTVNKDYTYSVAITEAGFPSTQSGTWAFLNKDKAADLKNKEALVLLSEKYVAGGYAATTGKTDDPYVLVLDMLANKKIVVTFNESSDDGSKKTTKIGTHTYIQ